MRYPSASAESATILGRERPDPRFRADLQRFLRKQSAAFVELRLSDSAKQVKARLPVDGRWFSCVRDGAVAGFNTPGQTVQALEHVEIANA